MIISALLMLATYSGSALKDNDVEIPQSYANADIIAETIRDGRDLKPLGLEKIVGDQVIAELHALAGCSPATKTDKSKNLVVVDFNCEPEAGTDVLDRTVELRFTDKGLLFALAVNPQRANYGPTNAAVAARNLPAIKKMAEQFANAIEQGGDPSLGGLVPLTELQRHQLAAIVGFRPDIQKPVSAAQKRSIREAYGPEVSIYEPPHNGFDINFARAKGSDQVPLMVTIFFDDGRRPIGVHIEDSLLRTSTTSETIN